MDLDQADAGGDVGVGFNGGYHHFFTPLSQELGAIIDVADPDHMGRDERRRTRLVQEDAHFDEDHYMYVEVKAAYVVVACSGLTGRADDNRWSRPGRGLQGRLYGGQQHSPTPGLHHTLAGAIVGCSVPPRTGAVACLDAAIRAGPQLVASESAGAHAVAHSVDAVPDRSLSVEAIAIVGALVACKPSSSPREPPVVALWGRKREPTPGDAGPVTGAR